VAVVGVRVEYAFFVTGELLIVRVSLIEFSCRIG
jgi:hypothetical protein